MSGTPEEVVTKLVEAAGTSCGWSRFDEVLDDGGLRALFVNAGAARFVTESTEPAR